jgi:hypothetical protein
VVSPLRMTYSALTPDACSLQLIPSKRGAAQDQPVDDLDEQPLKRLRREEKLLLRQKVSPSPARLWDSHRSILSPQKKLPVTPPKRLTDVFVFMAQKGGVDAHAWERVNEHAYLNRLHIRESSLYMGFPKHCQLEHDDSSSTACLRSRPVVRRCARRAVSRWPDQ